MAALGFWPIGYCRSAPKLPSTSIGFANWALDATTDGFGCCLQAEDANAITHVGFRYGVRTGTNAITYTVGLETIATTGIPSGTYLQNAGNDCKATFTPTNDGTLDGLWQWVALDHAYTPSIGQYLAATIRYASGVDASNYSSVSEAIQNTYDSHRFVPSWRLTAGTWSIRTDLAPWALRTASTRYGRPMQASYTTTTAATDNHRQALKFSISAGAGDTFAVAGFRATIIPNTGGATANRQMRACLWSASAELAAVDIDLDQDAASGSTGVREYFFTTQPTLTCGTTYYLGIEADGATPTALGIRGLTCASSDDLAAYVGGSNWHLATYNGSAWSDVTDTRPFVEPIIADITEPASSGVFVSGRRNTLIGR